MKTFLGEHDVDGLTVPQYLARLASEATTIINAYDYGRSIYDLAMRRELISIGEDVVNVAYDAPVDFEPARSDRGGRTATLSDCRDRALRRRLQRFSDAFQIAVNMAARAYEREGSRSGIATGLSDLDRYMGGLQASDLVILAGRPGMGKTALATNIAFNIAKTYRSRTRADGAVETADGGVVGFFSLKCRPSSWRPASSPSNPASPPTRFCRGDITENDFRRVADAVTEMQQIPFYIDQTGGVSIAQLAARARRLKRQRGLDMPVVDYLQLMTGSKSRAENRVQELTEITTGLKTLAKELNIPIVACSQLSRQVEQRDDKRPQLSDLRRIDRSSRTPTSSCSCSARNTISRTRSRARAPRSTSPGWRKWKARTAAPRSSSASSATAPPEQSNSSSTRR